MKNSFLRIIAILLCLCVLFTVLPGTSEPVAASSNSITVVTGATTAEEFRAVWMAYYDFNDTKNATKKEFRKAIGEKFDKVVQMGMNAVIVHVRPFSDAMYKSDYYPWSAYASGKQGVDPGYDPLEIMVEEAHSRDLEIHAWLNPYRVTSSGTDVTKLAEDNPARKWLTNRKKSDDRYVLAYHSALYYNPSISSVRKLIINGVKEIVQKYEVDGIHFDDYFYPALGEKTYKEYFDAPEYEAYAEKKRAAGEKPASIQKWRKSNVNKLVKGVYSAIKEIDPDVLFGISPGGYIDYFDDVHRWYVDYRTWMSKPGYIDYICPQIYWSFNTLNSYPFCETLLKWAAALKNPDVRLFVGIPAYKMNAGATIAGSTSIKDTEFYNQRLMAEMVHYSREIAPVSGFFFFDYEDMVDGRNKSAVQWLAGEWD